MTSKKIIPSDVKNRTNIIDYNDLSLIDIYGMVVDCDIILQYIAPNDFIQEQKYKLKKLKNLQLNL